MAWFSSFRSYKRKGYIVKVVFAGSNRVNQFRCTTFRKALSLKKRFSRRRGAMATISTLK